MLPLSRLSHQILALSSVALLVVLALAANSILNLQQLRSSAALHMRDARHGVLYAQFDISLTRAAGEAASYALTRRPAYYEEARAALAAGYAALARFQGSLVTASGDALDTEHRGYLKRYRELLAMVALGLERARHAALPTNVAQRDKLLDVIYAYEPLEEALRPEVAGHREREYARNEHAINKALNRTALAALTTLAVFALFVAALLAATRRQSRAPTRSPRDGRHRRGGGRS